MVKLLSRYSAQDIIIFTVFLALAFKGVFSFFSWLGDFLKDTVHRIEQPEKFKKELQKQSKQITELKNTLSDLNKSIHLLIESDKDAIKAYITRQHHYFVYQKKWIDDYSLDCIEKRYIHYDEQGGNSFISDLMTELRALPKQPKYYREAQKLAWKE